MTEGTPPSDRYEAADGVTVESLGTASEACASATAQLIGDVNYVVTYRQDTPTVAAFDLHERRVTDAVQLPVGKGSWASTALPGGTDLFIGGYGPARLFHVDVTDLTVREAVDPGTDKIHCVAAIPEEDTIVFGTKPAQIVYEYDHATGTVSDHGQPVPGETYVRSLAATPETIYAGIGAHMHLIEIDRRTGRKTELLPSELQVDGHVRDIELTPEYIVAVTTTGDIVLLDREDPTNYRIRPTSDEPDRAGAHLLHHVPGTDRLFVVDGKGMGRVLLYDLSADTLSVLVADEFGAREIDCWGETLLCTSDSMGVFGYDVSGDEATLEFATDYREAGMPYRPEEVQSVELDGHRLYVGGHRQTSIHDLETGSVEQVRHRGEPKVMAPVDGRLYQGVYPRAKVRRYDPTDATYEELAAIGHEQNRPRSIHYHSVSGRLLIGTRPQYGTLGGALATFDPEPDRLVGVDRDVFPDQSVTAITSVGDTVYLGSEIYGGGGSDPATDCAVIGTWDPLDRSIGWTTDLPDVAGLISLAPLGDRLYGLTEAYSNLAEVSSPSLVAFDPVGREYERIATFSPARGGDVIRHGDAIVGVTTNQLFRYDPSAGRTRILLNGLDPEGDSWHNFPQLASDDGRLYVIGERELLRVEA